MRIGEHLAILEVPLIVHSKAIIIFLLPSLFQEVSLIYYPYFNSHRWLLKSRAIVVRKIYLRQVIVNTC
jgi:hypothetical protein